MWGLPQSNLMAKDLFRWAVQSLLGINSSCCFNVVAQIITLKIVRTIHSFWINIEDES